MSISSSVSFQKKKYLSKVLSFRDWFLGIPFGAGEIWDNRTNSDNGFDVTGAKSKYTSSNSKASKPTANPDIKYTGKKRRKNGSSQR